MERSRAWFSAWRKAGRIGVIGFGAVTFGAWTLGSAGVAEAIVVRFDEPAAGTAIDSYYSAQGLTFNNPCVYPSSPCAIGSIYANGLSYLNSDSQSNVVSVWQSTSPGFDSRYGAVEAVFATGQRRVAVDARIMRLPEGLGTPANYPKLEIYNTSGSFITSVPWDFGVIPQPPAGGITGFQTLSYSSSTSNIGKVRLLSGNPGGGPSNFGIFDDLRAGGAALAHDLCSIGVVLAPTADACIDTICAADGYCCATGWDSICVGEVASLCGSNQCSAGTLVVDAVDGGYLSAVPVSPSSGVAFSGPAFASWNSSTGEPRARQFHKFDLSSVTQSIASARLILEYPKAATLNAGGTLMLQEVTSNPNTFGFDFVAGVHRAWSSAVFQDLVDGTHFGSRPYDTPDEGKVTSIELNAAAVAAINAARGGIFSIGGYHAGYPGPIVPAYSMLFDNSGDGDTGDDPRNGLPTLRRLVLVTMDDADGDLVADGADNCPYEPNPTQTDVGQLGGAGGDGIGDACQCGDIDDNGQITSSDVIVLQRAIAGLSPYYSVGGPANGQAAPGLPALTKCNVGGSGDPLATCTSSDATVISRAISALGPGITQTCAAALP